MSKLLNMPKIGVKMTEALITEWIVKEAPQTVKFALGENVKQSNSDRRSRGTRFPNTRAGVEAVIRRSFDAALAYRAAMTLLWDTRFSLATVLLAGFGRAIAEVGAVMIVGGNINGVTRVMTTTIALETSKGDLPLALALGLVLIAIVVLLNAAAHATRVASSARWPVRALRGDVSRSRRARRRARGRASRTRTAGCAGASSPHWPRASPWVSPWAQRPRWPRTPASTPPSCSPWRARRASPSRPPSAAARWRRSRTVACSRPGRTRRPCCAPGPG
jgi:hypothetical protein